MTDNRAFPLSPVSTRPALDIGVEKAEEQLSERFNLWRTRNAYRPFRVYHFKLIYFLGLQILEWVAQVIVLEEYFDDEETGEDRHRITSVLLLFFICLPWLVVAWILTYDSMSQKLADQKRAGWHWLYFPLLLAWHFFAYMVVDLVLTWTGFFLEALRYLYHLFVDFFWSEPIPVFQPMEKILFIPPYRMRSYIFFRGVFQFTFESVPCMVVVVAAVLQDYDDTAKKASAAALVITGISIVCNLTKIVRFRKETKLSIFEPAFQSMISFWKHGFKETHKISSKVTATCSMEEFPWVDFYNDVYVSMTLKPVPNYSLQYFKNVCRLAARTWHLQHFIASNISIADDGPLMVGHITEAMRRNHGLKLVDLSRNIISNRGSVPLSELIGHSATITALDISHNKIGEEGFSFISNALKINICMKTFDISSNSLGANSGTDVGNLLRLNYTLTDLRLNKCGLTDFSVEGISTGLRKNHALKKLWLRFNEIGPEGMDSLSQALLVNNSLNQLALEGNQIGDKGVEHLSTIFPHNNAVSTIELVNNNIGDKGAIALGSTIWRSDMLQYVYLSSNQISDVGMKALAEGIAQARVLAHLSVVCNRIGSVGISHLAEALKTNSSLIELHLGGNQITDSGVCQLAAALKTNKTLKILSLENNPFGEEGAGCLCDTMRNHRNLENLLIDGHSLSNAIIEQLKSLKSSKGEIRVSIRQKGQPSGDIGPISGPFTYSSMTHIAVDAETTSNAGSSLRDESVAIPVISSQIEDEFRTTILAMENVTLGMEGELELNMITRNE